MHIPFTHIKMLYPRAEMPDPWTGPCVLPGVGAESHTWVLCKSCALLTAEPSLHLFSPSIYFFGVSLIEICKALQSVLFVFVF